MTAEPVSKPATVGALAQHLGVELGWGENAWPLHGVAGADDAQPDQLTFVETLAAATDLSRRAGAVLCLPVHAPRLRAYAKAGLLSPHPRLDFARALAWLKPRRPPAPGIDPRAAVDPSARIHATARIEAFAVVGVEAHVGPRARVAAGAYIGDGASVGADSVLGPHAVLAANCAVGARCWIGPGAVIGSEGFGYAAETPTEGGPRRHWSLPQQGRVRLEDDVRLGAHTCVDRATFGETVIGAGTKVDNLVQVGHNVRVGQGCLLVAQSGVAGSTILDDDAVLAAQAGVAGHLRVGRGAVVGPQSGAMRNVPDGESIMGTPAVPKRRFLREFVLRGRLQDFFRRNRT